MAVVRNVLSRFADNGETLSLSRTRCESVSCRNRASVAIVSDGAAGAGIVHRRGMGLAGRAGDGQATADSSLRRDVHIQWDLTVFIGRESDVAASMGEACVFPRYGPGGQGIGSCGHTIIAVTLLVSI